MPWVDLYSKSDYASIFYTTNSSHSNVGGFDPEKPTIVILHPIFMDSTWLDLQFSDARLYNAYNLITFDMRCAGKSSCRPSGRHDSWVDAADLAFCYHELHLPPSHILALEGISVNCALRFAALFPEFCLSLTLVDIPPPVELKWVYNALDELTHATCFAEDHETFEHAAVECIEFLFGSDCDSDLKEELLSHWETMHPPPQRPRLVEMVSVLINRTSLSAEVYASITQPVLIIHGEKNELYPVKYAEKLVAQLSNAREGAILYTVKGGGMMLPVIPGNASIMNKVFCNFLTRLPSHRSDIRPPTMPSKERMRLALKKLGEINLNPEMAFLDPSSPLSFSCLPSDVIKSQNDLLAHYTRGAHAAFVPSPETRPAKRSFEKEQERWFYGGRGKLSVTKRGKTLTESAESISIRTVHTYTSLDALKVPLPGSTQQLEPLKVSSARTTNNPPINSLQRLLT